MKPRDLHRRKIRVQRLLYDLAGFIADPTTPAWIVGNTENHLRDLYMLVARVCFEQRRKKLHYDFTKEAP